MDCPYCDDNQGRSDGRGCKPCNDRSGMRIVFTGTRSFGVTALDALLADGHDVVRVWSPHDDKVSSRARALDIPRQGTMRPDQIAALDADVIVAAHSHAFISKPARQATRFGALGYHPSALPRHRGRDAVRWTIHMGDAIAGGSVYWFTDNVDAGPLAAREYVHVDPRWDASDLWSKALFPMGIRLLRKVLMDLDAGIVVEVPQNERCATVEPSFDQPRLFRPDLVGLPPIGGFRDGMERRVDAEALR